MVDGKPEIIRGRREAQEQGARRMNRQALRLVTDEAVVWYVAFVLSGKEYPAQRIISQQGTDVFLPLQRKWRKKNRYVKQKTRMAFPAIPGCIFVGFELGNERWLDFFATKTAYGVLGVKGCPISITGARLKAFIDGNYKRFDVSVEEQFMRSNCEFKTGDSVRIAEGPFEGHVVDVQSISGRSAQILIDLLGGIQNVEIPLDNLENAA